ncbi:MAG: hypothetical protein HN919_01115 [Verrucomicrobia bacterium]|jgi:hypothetical protein|nr:hypothetical protein [Verrucomicrobiota bacterium]MBT7702309.1 hypothetical protein [Verrucomicrobiota bacterium]
MTGIEKLESRIRRIRLCMAIGFGLYLIPILAAYFVPRLALLVPVGVAITVGGIIVAFRSLSCPECSGKLGNLLLIKQSGRLFALPPDLAICPHCGTDLDAHRGHEDLMEILSAYEKDGEYLGVVGTPMDGVIHRYELKLEGSARHTFKDIMQLQPFGKHGGATRYFFVPPSRRDMDNSASSRIKIRVEKGTEDSVVDIRASKPLRTLFEWLHQLQDPTQITRLSLRKTYRALTTHRGGYDD